MSVRSLNRGMCLISGASWIQELRSTSLSPWQSFNVSQELERLPDRETPKLAKPKKSVALRSQGKIL